MLHLPKPDVQKRAYGKAIKIFLELMQQELETAGYQDVQVRQFTKPLKAFIQDPEVAAVLGKVFDADCRLVATGDLAKAWQRLDLPYLPEDFDWEFVGKSYLRGIKKQIQESAELRTIFLPSIVSLYC
ncbi:MAG: hypothetical protein AAGD25_27800 [Cyanobacteria bacterium P01_F01_bin.150]